MQIISTISPLGLEDSMHAIKQEKKQCCAIILKAEGKLFVELTLPILKIHSLPTKKVPNDRMSIC